MMQARYHFLLAAVVSLLIFSAACSPERRADSNDEEKRTESRSEVVSRTSPDNPSGVVRAYLNAVKDRRYDEAKAYLSQDSLANLTQAAAQAGVNFDQALKQAIDADANQMTQNNTRSFETRNESITGNRATVEVKADNASQFARTSLVNENGVWKINVDETVPAGSPSNANPSR